MPIQVVGYIRESTQKQINETEGLQIQKDRIIAYCKSKNFKLAAMFSDEGVSGAKEINERPALQEMLEYCKNHPIQHVIVDKADRLSRKFENQLYVEMILLRNKIDIKFSANETTNIDENDTEFDMMMKTAMRQMMGVFAELDRKMIVKRLSDGMTKKASNGHKAAGKQPLGYEYSQDKKSTVVNNQEAKIIKYIYSLRADGIPYEKIADILNSKKIYTKQNNLWKFQSVQWIINNDFYIGVVTHGGKKYPGNHEPIIDMDLWARVRALNRTPVRVADAA